MIIKIAQRLGLIDHVRAVAKHDTRDALKPVQHNLKKLLHQLTAVQNQLQQVETTLAACAEQSARAERIGLQTKSMLRLNDAHRGLVAQLDTLLDEPRIVAHVQQAIAVAPLQTDPYPHIVVEDLFPADFYKLLRQAIPPPAFFGDHDLIKQNLRTPIEFGPALSIRVLNFLEEALARRAIRPAVIQKFHEPLQRHYDAIFGPEFRDRANQLPQSVSGGRVMLRRPGYHLSAHRDPKRSMLTCLLYFASGKDSEDYGTNIYRVLDDREANYTQTYYPEQNGSRCELVKRVPFRPNTMLVFLNSTGAHGALIPEDAPAKLERYSYQFYIGPSPEGLGELIKDLPPERQAMWRSKSEVESEYA